MHIYLINKILPGMAHLLRNKTALPKIVGRRNLVLRGSSEGEIGEGITETCQ